MPSSTLPASAFDTIPDAIAAFRNGEFLVVLDDPSRENEADLIISAQSITTAQMAFMIRHSSGLICAPLAPHLTESLELPQMVPLTATQDPRGTAYTLSVDAADPSDGVEVEGKALREGGGMMRAEGCIAFARKFGLKVVTIADLVAYLEKTEGKVEVNGA
ncbi:hypothetical protein VdG1_05205 [Verticillium dahliae VDG1]|nr:hypothetical protein VdG1_05205 [Verticillium dahliae VDG1]